MVDDQHDHGRGARPHRHRAGGGRRDGHRLRRRPCRRCSTTIITEHGAVVFNGDGYSEEWPIEAESGACRTSHDARRPARADHRRGDGAVREVRGLQRARDAQPLRDRPRAVRADHRRRGEADAGDRHRRSILPAAVRYQTELAQNIAALKAAGVEADTAPLDEVVGAARRRCGRRSPAWRRRSRPTPGDTALAEAEHAGDALLPAMAAVRAAADALEGDRGRRPVAAADLPGDALHPLTDVACSGGRRPDRNAAPVLPRCGPVFALQGGGEGPRWEGRQGPSSALDRAVLLLDVLAHDAERCAADGAGEVRTRPAACWPGSSGGPGRGTPAASGGTETPLRLLTSFARATLGGKLTSRWTWLFSPLNSTSSVSKSAHTARMISSMRVEVPVGEHLVPELRHEDQVSVQGEDAVSASADAVEFSHKPMVAVRVQLRYNYRLYPTPVSARRWPGRSGAPGWCSTTGCGARQDARAAGRAVPLGRGAVQAGHHRGEAHAGAGVAGRGVVGGAAAGAGGPEHGVPQLLRLDHGQAQGPQGGTAAVPVPQGQPAGDPVHQERPVQGAATTAGCGCRRSAT